MPDVVPGVGNVVINETDELLAVMEVTSSRSGGGGGEGEKTNEQTGRQAKPESIR